MATIKGDGGANVLSGGDGDDVITGLGGNDYITGGGGADLMNGGADNDYINSAVDDGAADTLLGGAGDDNLIGSRGDSLDGGEGLDSFSLMLTTTTEALSLHLRGLTSGGSLALADGTSVTGVEGGYIYFGSGGDFAKLGDAKVMLFGGGGNDTLIGTHGDDDLGGGLGDDLLKGGKGVDTVLYTDLLHGVHVDLSIAGAQDTQGAGMDTLVSVENLVGSTQADVLIGRRGANELNGSWGGDTLTGGAGADHFVFGSVTDTSTSAPDHVTDLAAKDVIDLHFIDADLTADGDQAFVLVSSFTGHAGEAVLSFDGTDTHLRMDISGDGAADGEVVLEGDQTGFDNFVL